MPGDVLLFQRLSVSTIGAVWFHGRVRDGIGWVTDAMATKQWSQRNRAAHQNNVLMRPLRVGSKIDACTTMVSEPPAMSGSDLSLMVGLSSANRAISIG